MSSASNSKKIYCSKYPTSVPYILSISFNEKNPSVTNNTSLVNITGSIESTGASWDSAFNSYLKLYWYDNFTQKESLIATSNAFQDLNTNEKISLSASHSVSHKEDGSLNGYATLKYVAGSTSGGYAPTSFSVSTMNTALTKINRVSSISSIVGNNLGEEVIVNISRLVSSYFHKVEWKIGNSAYVTASDQATTTCSFTPSLNYASYSVNSNRVNLTVKVTTMKDNVSIGNVTQSISLNIPDVDEVKPTFDFVLTRIDNGIPSDWNVFVQGYSKCKLDILNAQGRYGASIASYSINGAGLSTTTSSLTTEVLNQKAYTFKASVVDSRGRVQTKEINLSVLEYSLPSIILNAKRCTSDGTISTSGTYLSITCTPTYASLSGKNTISKAVSCNGVIHDSFTDGETFILNANCSIGTTYLVSASLTDALGNSASVTTKIPTSERIVNIKKNKKGIAFGGFSEEDNVLKSYWPIHVEGDIYSNEKKVSLEDHVHTYAGASSPGGAALKVEKALRISLNGVSQGSYDGSNTQSINITPSAIGAASSSHSHNYSPVGAQSSNGGALTLWSGSSTSPSFTVNQITQYKYFLVGVGNSSSEYATWIFVPYTSISKTGTFRGIGGWETESSTYGAELYSLRGTIANATSSNATLSIASCYLRRTYNITTNANSIQMYIKRVIGVK